MAAHDRGRTAMVWAFAGVYLVYLAGVAAFHRGFAGIHVDVLGVPLFVGEATIGLLAVLLVGLTLAERRLPFEFDGTAKALCAYLGIGAGFAAIGMAQGYGVASLRDFALVYYLAFFFYTLAAIRLGIQPRTILNALAFGSVVGAIVALVSFAIAPSLSYEHGAPGHQAPAVWLGALWCLLSASEGKGRLPRAFFVGGAAVNLSTIYLIGYRTMLPVMFVSAIILWGWTAASRGVSRRALLRSSVAASIAALAFMLGIAMHTLTMTAPERPVPVNGPVELGDGLKVLSYRWVRGFKLLAPTVIHVVRESDGDVEDSLRFRIEAWSRALERIRSSPITGIGLGPAPALYADRYCDTPYSPTSNCGNAHNTYLTLAMRMGIPVFLFFVATNLSVLTRFVRRAVRHSDEAQPTLLAPFLAAALASLGVYAFMSLFFESPYLSPLFWVVLAMMNTLANSTAGSRPGSAE